MTTKGRKLVLVFAKPTVPDWTVNEIRRINQDAFWVNDSGEVFAIFHDQPRKWTQLFSQKLKRQGVEANPGYRAIPRYRLYIGQDFPSGKAYVFGVYRGTERVIHQNWREPCPWCDEVGKLYSQWLTDDINRHAVGPGTIVWCENCHRKAEVYQKVKDSYFVDLLEFLRGVPRVPAGPGSAHARKMAEQELRRLGRYSHAKRQKFGLAPIQPNGLGDVRSKKERG